MLLTVGRSYVGNNVTHSTLLDRACTCSYTNLPKYRSYRVSNMAPRNRHPARHPALTTDALQNEETQRAYKEKLTEAICEETSQQTNLQQLIETTSTARLLVGETAKPPVRFQCNPSSIRSKGHQHQVHDGNLPAEQSSQSSTTRTQPCVS